jgi:choline-sulfatase
MPIESAYDHIVLISIDTLRSDALDVNPHKLWYDTYPGLAPPRTLILDKLAASGTFFPNCISAAPYTSASHASILTGKWPVRHGMYEFFNRKLAVSTLFSRARRDGRRTLLKSDFPLILGPPLGFDRDVDTFIVEDDDMFLRSLSEAGRSLSLVHFGGVHVPYGFHNLRYGGDAYRDKVAQLERSVDSSGPLPRDQLLETFRDDEDIEYLLRYKRIIEQMWRAGRAAEIFGLYLEGVQYFLETRFAPLMERLLAILDGSRWLLVLFGDHGEEYDADSFGHFNSVAEGVLRVPLILVGADVVPQTCWTRVRTVDILPTLLELDGTPSSRFKGVDGTSLAAIARGDRGAPDRTAYAQAYVADTANFIRFQRRMLSTGRKKGALPHVRYKEAVWHGEYKLTRQLAGFSSYLAELAPLDPPLGRLERLSGDGRRPHRVDQPAMSRRLERELEEYNSLRRAAS